MPTTDIDSVSITDQESDETIYSVDSENTDSASGDKETEWINTRWGDYLGYYKKVPELAAAIDAKATWSIGKGFKSNPITELALTNITGWGKDTFNTILENAVRTYYIGGDAFIEIIRNKNGQLMNLKPLDPGSIKIVANSKGRILRYEQVEKVDSRLKAVAQFEPDEIIHFARNRVADEIHGVSIITAVEEIILARNEAMADYKILLRRNVKPIKIWEVDTDDTTEIATFKAKVDEAGSDAENLIIPKGSVLPPTISAVPSNSTLNPLPWIQQLNQYFFQAVGVPQIIVGGAQEITEASAKIAYLAFEQVIEEEQLFIEEQILAQLNLEIELEFPASLKNEMLSDMSKSESMQASTPEDTMVSTGNEGGVF